MYVCVRFTYVCTNVHGKGHMSTREKGGLMLMSSSLARLVLPRYGVWCVGHLVLSVRVWPAAFDSAHPASQSVDRLCHLLCVVRFHTCLLALHVGVGSARVL